MQVVNYLLRTYATDEVISREDTKLHRFSQPDGMNETDYAHVRWENVLRFGSVYDEAKLKALFIEGLRESIRDNVRNYWSANEHLDLSQLARYASSMSRIGTTRGTEAPTQPNPRQQ